jgi:hypothetical protein
VDKEEGKAVIAEPPGEEDTGEFFLEVFPEISLNAITGTPTPKTIRIVGFTKTN